MSDLRAFLFFFFFSLASGCIAFGQCVTLDNPLPTPRRNQIGEMQIAANGDRISVEVELSESVTPTLTFAENPDRLIADFPNVLPKEWLKHIPVGKNGVVQVRIGLTQASPPITRVVVDLDSLHPVTVEASNRKVMLNILPALTNRASEKAGPSKAREEGNRTTNLARVSPTKSLEPHFTPPVEPDAAQQGASPPIGVGFQIKGASETTPSSEDGLTTTGFAMAESQPGPSSERSRLRWILPVLTTSVIIAMLVIALVSHIQNKKLGRGI